MNRRRIILAGAVLAAVVALGLLLLRPDEPAGDKKPPPKKTGDTRRVITVSTAKEFIEAIGSDRIIRLEPGEYLIPDGPIEETAHVYQDYTIPWVEKSLTLIIRDVRNLTIEGAGEGPVRLVRDSNYADVLCFEDSQDVKLVNVELGHVPDPAECTGAVLGLRNCREVRVERSVLFGCGSRGLHAIEVEGLDFSDSVIRDCTEGIMRVMNSCDVVFRSSRFEKNRVYDGRGGIAVKGSRNVLFDDCDILENRGEHIYDESGNPPAEIFLFDIAASENVRVTNSRITKNAFDRLLQHPGTIRFTNCVIKGNKFRKDGGVE